MKVEDLDAVISILQEKLREWGLPYVSELSRKTRDPYRVLVSCLLSLRTRDNVTAEASRRLFNVVKSPDDMLKLSPEEIERLIYPVGFYKNKARVLREVSKDIIEKYGGKVPDTMEELLKLKGVGRKTANLVLIKGYGKEGICVDTHVHRISNRWGLVSTKSPEETEMELRKVLPRKYWCIYNDLLVPFGQKICVPVSPKCSDCPVSGFCERVGVSTSR